MSLRRKSRTLKLIIAAVILCMCVVSVIAFHVREGRRNAAKTFIYAALGDSIPNGYSAAEEDTVSGYPRLLAEDIEAEEEVDLELLWYTKDGLTVDGLYETYLSDHKVQENLKKADLITVTIGANDLLKGFQDAYREISGKEIKAQDLDGTLKILQKEGYGEPELLVRAAERIYSWDCSEFEKDWAKAMESVRKNRKEGAEVIVTTVYDPVRKDAGFGVLERAAAVLIGRVNAIIVRDCERYGYQAADISGIGMEGHLQSDGLHPDSRGQRMIMEQIKMKRR